MIEKTIRVVKQKTVILIGGDLQKPKRGIA